MVKVSSNEIEIQKITKRIQMIESNIADYNNHRGCIYFCSLFNDKAFIHELYELLAEERIKYDEAIKFQ
jgi:hypothetical protein